MLTDKNANKCLFIMFIKCDIQKWKKSKNSTGGAGVHLFRTLLAGIKQGTVDSIGANVKQLQQLKLYQEKM